MAQSASSTSDRLPRMLVRQFGMLITQFLLGMALTLIGNPSSSLGQWSDRIILLLHVLIAIALIINGVALIKAANGSPNAGLARAGIAGVGLAFLFGILTLAAPLSSLWSFGMAAAFLAAFVMYGRLYMQAKMTNRPR